MGKPKKRTSPRATGARRSHLILKLARAVNKKSPVKAVTTRRETGKKLAAATTTKKVAKTAKKSK
jgi:ribosomal protein L32